MLVLVKLECTSFGEPKAKGARDIGFSPILDFGLRDRGGKAARGSRRRVRALESFVGGRGCLVGAEGLRCGDVRVEGNDLLDFTPSF